MDKQAVQSMTPTERVQMSTKPPKRARSRGSQTHGGARQARAGWSCDDTEITAVPTKNLPGKYRVSLPARATKYVRGPKHG
jgi:hypothetical protein